MAPRKPTRPQREQRHTVLLAGEGLAEQNLLNHLKALYLPRGAPKTVSVKNAKGKGGAQVLDYCRRQQKTAAFDEAAVLLDTDTQWGPSQQALARKEGIRVFECTPCLEAVLLRIAGKPLSVGQTVDYKRAFHTAFGCEAHDPNVLERVFPKPVLDAARSRVPELAALLAFLEA